eukprot:9207799-Pyramimonas_sp.AAC.1
MGQRVTQASPERPPGSRPQKSLTRARGARRRLTLSYASLIMGARTGCDREGDKTDMQPVAATLLSSLLQGSWSRQ